MDAHEGSVDEWLLEELVVQVVLGGQRRADRMRSRYVRKPHGFAEVLSQLLWVLVQVSWDLDLNRERDIPGREENFPARFVVRH